MMKVHQTRRSPLKPICLHTVTLSEVTLVTESDFEFHDFSDMNIVPMDQLVKFHAYLCRAVATASNKRFNEVMAIGLTLAAQAVSRLEDEEIVHSVLGRDGQTSGTSVHVVTTIPAPVWVRYFSESGLADQYEVIDYVMRSSYEPVALFRKASLDLHVLNSSIDSKLKVTNFVGPIGIGVLDFILREHFVVAMGELYSTETVYMDEKLKKYAISLPSETPSVNKLAMIRWIVCELVEWGNEDEPAKRDMEFIDVLGALRLMGETYGEILIEAKLMEEFIIACRELFLQTVDIDLFLPHYQLWAEKQIKKGREPMAESELIELMVALASLS